MNKIIFQRNALLHATELKKSEKNEIIELLENELPKRISLLEKATTYKEKLHLRFFTKNYKSYKIRCLFLNTLSIGEQGIEIISVYNLDEVSSKLFFTEKSLKGLEDCRIDKEDATDEITKYIAMFPNMYFCLSIYTPKVNIRFEVEYCNETSLFNVLNIGETFEQKKFNMDETKRDNDICVIRDEQITQYCVNADLKPEYIYDFTQDQAQLLVPNLLHKDYLTIFTKDHVRIKFSISSDRKSVKITDINDVSKLYYKIKMPKMLRNKAENLRPGLKSIVMNIKDLLPWEIRTLRDKHNIKDQKSFDIFCGIVNLRIFVEYRNNKIEIVDIEEIPDEIVELNTEVISLTDDITLYKHK